MTAGIIVFLLGLAVGSFLNVCIYRLPRGESVVSPPSHCPRCGKRIRWYHNVPVIGWLVIRGRCADCGSPVSPRYPIVELTTGVLFAMQYAAVGLEPLLVARLLFTPALVALFAIDLEHQLLPNTITLPGIGVGLAASFVGPPGPVDALLGVLLGGGVLWAIGEAYVRIRHIEGLGFGDVKMLAMIGAFLGWKLTVLTLALASFAGAIVGVAIMIRRGRDLRHALPFGTFLAMGAFVASLVGDRIVEWYASLYTLPS